VESIALKLYLDSGFTQEVTQGTEVTPDIAHGSGTVGFTAKRQLWVKNDTALKYYESISVTAVNDTADIAVTYSATENGSYTDSLALSNVGALGGGSDNTTFWRKVVVASSVAQQNKTNIDHRITSTEYIA
jgi:hypothetical protein